MLLAAGIDPRGMLEFFRKIGTGEGIALPRYLSSHPPSADRVERLKALAATAPPAAPLLAEYDWADVRKMCASARPPESPPR
jgi:predicted Zn-dependent protease